MVKVGYALAALAAASVWPGVAFAEMITKQLLARYDKGDERVRESIELGLANTAVGFSWANAELANVRRQRALFCAPPGVLQTGEQYLDILRRGANSNSVIAEAPYGLGLLAALQEAFPCKEEDQIDRRTEDG